MRRSTRSPVGSASGSPSARSATYCAVHGPIPGSAAIAAASSSGAAPKSMPRSSQARASARSVAWRAPVMPRPSRFAPARFAGPGKRSVRPSVPPAIAIPALSTSRRASVQPAATLTCWPSTARTAHSNTSHAPGMRSPGRSRTSGPISGSVASSTPMRAGSAARSNARRATEASCRSEAGGAPVTRSSSASSPESARTQMSACPPSQATVRA